MKQSADSKASGSFWNLREPEWLERPRGESCAGHSKRLDGMRLSKAMIEACFA